MALKLDDRSLDQISEAIKKYCKLQQDAINDYYRKMRGLEEWWQGSNFDYLRKKTERLTDLTEKVMADLEEKYTRYFNEKAGMIRHRPAFGHASSGAACSSSGKKAKTGKSAIDKVFEECNAEIAKKAYFYLRKINFYKPDERICFYDPNGRSKCGLYKNIMAIDINSDTFKQDLTLLTGQHIYFQLEHSRHMQLISCLGTELKNKAFYNIAEYVELTDRIKSGKGIDLRYLKFSSDDARVAFNFFTLVFQSALTDNKVETDKYKKYYSHSYQQFCEILNNLNAGN